MKGGIEKQIQRVGAQELLELNQNRGKSLVSDPKEFKKTLDNFNNEIKPELKKVDNLNQPEIKFSNHAVERMIHRGIKFSQDDLNNLNKAVQKADLKGAKDTLVLLNDSALIVSVKNKTVVTVMDKNALKENVFTNIDSTVVL